VTPMPALATDALLPAQKKNPAIGAGLLSLVEKSVAANYLTPRRLLAKTRVRNRNSAKSRPELFGIDSGESGRRTGGIFR